MFVMLLPTILPMARPELPLAQENTLMINSGREVPKATMVKPMIKGDIFALIPMLVAPSTSQLAPKIKATKPTINNKICKTISLAISLYPYLLSFIFYLA